MFYLILAILFLAFIISNPWVIPVVLVIVGLIIAFGTSKPKPAEPIEKKTDGATMRVTCHED